MVCSDEERAVPEAERASYLVGAAAIVLQARLPRRRVLREAQRRGDSNLDPGAWLHAFHWSRGGMLAAEPARARQQDVHEEVVGEPPVLAHAKLVEQDHRLSPPLRPPGARSGGQLAPRRARRRSLSLGTRDLLCERKSGEESAGSLRSGRVGARQEVRGDAEAVPDGYEIVNRDEPVGLRRAQVTERGSAARRLGSAGTLLPAALSGGESEAAQNAGRGIERHLLSVDAAERAEEDLFRRLAERRLHERGVLVVSAQWLEAAALRRAVAAR